MQNQIDHLESNLYGLGTLIVVCMDILLIGMIGVDLCNICAG